MSLREDTPGGYIPNERDCSLEWDCSRPVEEGRALSRALGF